MITNIITIFLAIFVISLIILLFESKKTIEVKYIKKCLKNSAIYSLSGVIILGAIIAAFLSFNQIISQIL